MLARRAVLWATSSRSPGGAQALQQWRATRRPASQGRQPVAMVREETWGDGVKVANEEAEELREKTGVQLDPDAWLAEAPGRAAPGEAASVWYYAFGSNMNKRVLEGRRMVKPAESVPAVCPGYRLAFNMPGMPYREPAFASVERIEPSATPRSNGSTNSEGVGLEQRRHTARAAQAAANGASSNGSSGSGGSSDVVEVHGVAHRITPKEWEYVLETEGAAGHSKDYGYAVEPVCVRTYDGRTLEAVTLVCQPKSVATLQGRQALPSKRYLDLLRVGAAEYGLAPEYQAYLQQLSHYEADTLGRRAGGVVMAGVFLGLVAPVFLSQRLWAKLAGMSGPGSSLRTRLTARYLHFAFGLVWKLHGVLEPALGCGCSNGGGGAAAAAAKAE